MALSYPFNCVDDYPKSKVSFSAAFAFGACLNVTSRRRGNSMPLPASISSMVNNRIRGTALDAWFHEVEAASWKNPAEVKAAYANASIVGNDRVVFNIKGNSFRLVVAVDYIRQVVFIKWVGSHPDYDRIDAAKVGYAGKTDQK